MSLGSPKSSDYVDKAIKAVRDGVESNEQRAEVVAASKQTGSRGREAKRALQGH